MTRETRMHTYQTPAPVRLRVEIPKGRVRVVAEETGETRVRLTAINGDALAEAWIADAEVGQNGDEIVVRVHKHGMSLFGMGGAIEAEVHVPLGSGAGLSHRLRPHRDHRPVGRDHRLHRLGRDPPG